MEAAYYEKMSNQIVRCILCPRHCKIKPGETGNCNIRRNIEGKLQCETYLLFSGIGFDPVEKKPLYHFYPGRQILSAGSAGCNLHCQWCQNCEISQSGIKSIIKMARYSPGDLLTMALQSSENIGIAYTYNEPSINYETIIETARLFSKHGLKNVMVTNGYISPGPLGDYLRYIDAFNVDVKAFTDKTYLKYTGGRLKPVLFNLEQIKKAGRHLEITCLVVPGVSDDKSGFEWFVGWVSSNLGIDVPLHISRYFPRYNFTARATTEKQLNEFFSIAGPKLNYVYSGNIIDGKYQNTYCPNCHGLIISRNGYYVQKLTKNNLGICDTCGTKIFAEG